MTRVRDMAGEPNSRGAPWITYYHIPVYHQRYYYHQILFYRTAPLIELYYGTLDQYTVVCLSPPRINLFLINIKSKDLCQNLYLLRSLSWSQLIRWPYIGHCWEVAGAPHLSRPTVLYTLGKMNSACVKAMSNREQSSCQLLRLNQLVSHAWTTNVLLSLGHIPMCLASGTTKTSQLFVSASLIHDLSATPQTSKTEYFIPSWAMNLIAGKREYSHNISRYLSCFSGTVVPIIRFICNGNLQYSSKITDWSAVSFVSSEMAQMAIDALQALEYSGTRAVQWLFVVCGLSA